MKPGIIAALVVSLVLVGGAAWMREKGQPEASLAVVPTQKLSDSYYDELVSKYLGTSSSSPEERESLTTTDLVGRQLISDYLNLAQNGQATDANVSALAAQYADSIPTIVSAQKIAPLDLHVVSNTQANFDAYSSAMTAIYNTYSSGILSAKGRGSPGSAQDVPWGELEKVYTQTVESLKGLSVPAGIADDHAKLVNIYLEDAAACHALAISSSDPAASFAGLILWNNNAEKERQIISDMQNIVSRYGL
jgi:hypothetical protein